MTTKRLLIPPGHLLLPTRNSIYRRLCPSQGLENKRLSHLVHRNSSWATRKFDTEAESLEHCCRPHWAAVWRPQEKTPESTFQKNLRNTSCHLKFSYSLSLLVPMLIKLQVLGHLFWIEAVSILAIRQNRGFNMSRQKGLGKDPIPKEDGADHIFASEKTDQVV